MPRKALTEVSVAVVPNVRAELARQGISQEVIAKKLGLTRHQISRRLRGQTAFRRRELSQIAKHLDIPLAELLGENESRAS